jgi:hypothetical protein
MLATHLATLNITASPHCACRQPQQAGDGGVSRRATAALTQCDEPGLQPVGHGAPAMLALPGLPGPHLRWQRRVIRQPAPGRSFLRKPGSSWRRDRQRRVRHLRRHPCHGTVKVCSTAGNSVSGLPLATPVHRSQLCADRVSGRTISPMGMAREVRKLVRMVSGAMRIRFARCQRVVIPCAARRPRSSFDFAATRNSREAPQALALWRAGHGRRRHRFDDHPRDLRLAMEFAHCVARAPTCKNCVEVRLTALGSEPRNSSIPASERSSSAHRWDLCIGVVNGQPDAAGKRQLHHLNLTLDVARPPSLAWGAGSDGESAAGPISSAG